MKSQKHLSLTTTTADFIFILLFLLLIPNSLFLKAFAASPAFDEVFITDKKPILVQTYGDNSTQLRSRYANILAVNYVSDGKSLNATLWLKSKSENASTYSQPLKHLRYGMLIAIVSLPQNSGYNGANYDFYIEAVNGKWSEYLYQLSSRPIILYVDRDRLIRVIHNLLDNSVKFSKEDGTIVVEVKEEKDQQQDKVIVSVKDTGQGIDLDILPRLFSKFVTKSYQGTGLGLYISKGIIKAHGGRIWAENNNDGKGATFSFSLPIVAQISTVDG